MFDPIIANGTAVLPTGAEPPSPPISALAAGKIAAIGAPPGRMVDFGDMWAVLKVLAQTGGIAAIHAEDNDLVMHMYGSMSGFPDDPFRGNDG
jgi:hypothetical protein